MSPFASPASRSFADDHTLKGGRSDNRTEEQEAPTATVPAEAPGRQRNS